MLAIYFICFVGLMVLPHPYTRKQNLTPSRKRRSTIGTSSHVDGLPFTAIKIIKSRAKIQNVIEINPDISTSLLAPGIIFQKVNMWVQPALLLLNTALIIFTLSRQ